MDAILGNKENPDKKSNLPNLVIKKIYSIFKQKNGFEQISKIILSKNVEYFENLSIKKEK